MSPSHPCSSDVVGHRQVVVSGPTGEATLARSSSCGSNPADVGSHLERLRPCGSILVGGDVVAAEMKGVVDLVVGGEETLCLSRRLEALHLSFSPSRRLMRVLGSIVQALVLSMLNARHDLPLCRPVAGQLISDHDARRPALPLQQLAEQALGGALIAPALTSTSSTIPIWSTARQSQCFLPAILMAISSRCYLSPVAGRRRRIWLA